MLDLPTTPRITDLSRDELIAWCQEQGAPAFRADQVRHWIFQKRKSDFDQMHDLPASLRAALKASFQILSAKIVRHQVARDRTEKLLIEMCDGHHVECVLMREPKRRTICISTQVGCAMGCVFCASGLQGVKRNLTSGEILEQVLYLDRLLDDDERISHVVVMGIGEPLANLKQLLKAIASMNGKGGLDISARRIAISTVGLPDGIRELAATGKPYQLAISLHAPNNALRNKLVPVNRTIGVEAILQAADDYFETTGRRVTFEYVLLGGVNDSVSHARELATLLRGRGAHVNVIPMNQVKQLPFETPSSGRTRQFIEILEADGVKATIRKRKGEDIDAACGQLRLEQTAQSPA